MVYKRSEYGLQFKTSSHQKNIPVYKENLNYRYSRRERECAHTPIAWDDEVVEDVDIDEKLSADEEVDNLPLSEMAVIDEEKEATEEEDDIAKEKRIALEKDKQSQAQENDLKIVKQSDKLGKLARANLNKYVCKEIKENLDEPAVVKEAAEKKSLGKTFVKPKKADDKLFIQCLKPKRPDRQKKIPKARPGSAPPSKRPESRGGAKSPFVAYGCGGNRESVGESKTFNIRASSAVYPAALRAQKRNKLAIEKKLEQERTSSTREKKKKALFNERMARETVSWSSEYRRCFPAYDNTVYATSDTEPRKQKSFFTT